MGDEETPNENYRVMTLQVDRGCGCGNMSGFYQGIHAKAYQQGILPSKVQIPFRIGKNTLEIPEVTVRTLTEGDKTTESFYVPRSGGEPVPVSVEKFIELVEERGGLVRIMELPAPFQK